MTVDLSTRYLGLELGSPLVASPSPLGHSLEMLQRLEDAGAAAVVLPSLFEEQIEHEAFEVHRVLEAGSESFGEALSYFPELDDYNTGPGPYLDHLSAAKERLTIPVIGSLNGSSPGGWVRYARLMQDAGADALELNVYFVATDVSMTSEQVEQRYLELVRAVREVVTIPVAVKVGPVLQLDREHGAPPGRGGRRRARPLQPVRAAGHRPRDAQRRARGEPLDLRRAAAAAALDRDPARARRRLARRDDRRPSAPRTC